MESYLKREKEEDASNLSDLQEKIKILKKRLQHQEQQIEETRQLLKQTHTSELDEHIQKLHRITAEQLQTEQE